MFRFSFGILWMRVLLLCVQSSSHLLATERFFNSTSFVRRLFSIHYLVYPSIQFHLVDVQFNFYFVHLFIRSSVGLMKYWNYVYQDMRCANKQPTDRLKKRAPQIFVGWTVKFKTTHHIQNPQSTGKKHRKDCKRMVALEWELVGYCKIIVMWIYQGWDLTWYGLNGKNWMGTVSSSSPAKQWIKCWNFETIKRNS